MGWKERDLHLIVIDDGRLLEGSDEPMVITLDLETGEVDYELSKWIDAGEEAGWVRVL